MPLAYPDDLIDVTGPIEPTYPLNRERQFWLYGLPQWSGGLVFRDLCRRFDGAAVGTPGWQETGRGELGISASGGSGVSVTVPYTGYVSGTDYGQSWWLAFWVYPKTWPGPFTALIDDTGRKLHSFYNASGSPSFGYTGWGSLPAGSWYHLIRTLRVTSPTGATDVAFVNGKKTATTVSPAVGWTTAITAQFGPNPSGGGTAGNAVYADLTFAAGRSLSDAEAPAVYDQSRRGNQDALCRLRPWSFGVTTISPPPPPPAAGLLLRRRRVAR